MNHPLGDVLNIAVYAYAAAVYSKDLSENATRGRRSEGEKGWWVNGQAPWGTKRKDTLEDRILEPGEKSKPGGGGTILVEDPDILPHWRPSAESFLAGASYKGIGEDLYDVGLRGPQGGALGHRHIRNFLTNRHLIGEVKVRDADGNVQWPPPSGMRWSIAHCSRRSCRRRSGGSHSPGTRSARRRGPSSCGPHAPTAGSSTTADVTERSRGVHAHTSTRNPTRSITPRSTTPMWSTSAAGGLYSRTSSKGRSRTSFSVSGRL